MRERIIPYIATAISAVAILAFTFFFMDSSNSEPTVGTTQTDERANETTPDNGVVEESNIINNVQNQINGDQSEVSNSVENDVKGNSNQVENNITNHIDVKVDVNVTNNITNSIDNQKKQNTESTNSNRNDQNSTIENNGQNNDNGDSDENGDEVVWGVDSASLTTDDLLACVRNNFGDPQVWGRYLGDKEGVSAGLTSEEVELLQENGIEILVIWNHFSDATGYENGENEANAAINLAKELGIPKGAAIFADIEPSYPVDSAFIQGWYEAMNQSGYEPGIYGIFDDDRNLTSAYNAAIDSNSEILENTFIWTASPNVGITTQANAPQYQPETPNNALVAGWQYGIDAQTCNIDTNLFNNEVLDALW